MELHAVRQAILKPAQAGHVEIIPPRNSSSISKSQNQNLPSISSRTIFRKRPCACSCISACPVAAIHSITAGAEKTLLGATSKRSNKSEARLLQVRRLRSVWKESGLRSSFTGTSLIRIAAEPSVTSSGAHDFVAPIYALSTDDFLSGNDLSPVYKSWDDFVSSLTNSDVVRGSLDRLGESATAIVSKGSELSDTVAAKLGDGTVALQASKALQEQLEGLEQSATAVFNKGSEILEIVEMKSGEILENVTARSGEILQSITEKSGGLAQPSSQTFHAFGNSSSNVLVDNSPSLETLGQSASRLVASAGTWTSEVGSMLDQFTGQLFHLDTTAISHSAGHLLSEVGTTVGSYYDGFAPTGAPVAVAAALVTVAGSAAVMASSSATNYNRNLVEGEHLPLRYDPVAIGSFFRRRPAEIMFRATKIMVECSSLTVSILADISSGKAQQNEHRRAVQLVDLITRLGPTAIKIGQALSIRPDILPVVYLEELQKLQDRVPPFSDEEAKALILQGLGRTAEEVFSEMSESPVAAASLGQVYKAKLRATGDVVAVKVQRPGVLEGISRDLFLLRTGAFALEKFPSVQSDLVGLLDTWALRFFDEMDYMQEGRNAVEFAENMKSLANVTVPGVYMEHTSRKVLTTQWVDGEKLSETMADDLLPLISTALNCYLVQLLESGFLHADPHPGNLLRTPDGKLCVLDFGLMTQVTEDQRYALIDYISHLVNSDYARVAEDLVKLGFVPAGMEDPEKTAAVVPQLTRVLGQLVKGGGARKINMQQVYEDLSKMAKDYVFVIPPYFALILRAFSVLEGIGLEADPDYTIVAECYPYISKRLLTDDSPRARAALKDFLYGGKGQLDIKRVEEMVAGFQSFRAVMAPSGVARANPRQHKSQVLDATTKEALTIVFAPEGSYIQELLLVELVRSVDALSREALAQFWQLIASTLRIPGLPIPASLSMPGSWPLPVPGLLFGMTRVARLSEEDEQSLDTVRRIWRLLEPSFVLPSPTEIFDFFQEIIPLFFSLLPGVTTASRRFTVMLLQRLALRFADDLDGTNSVLEWNKDPLASIRDFQSRK